MVVRAKPCSRKTARATASSSGPWLPLGRPRLRVAITHLPLVRDRILAAVDGLLIPPSVHLTDDPHPDGPTARPRLHPERTPRLAGRAGRRQARRKHAERHAGPRWTVLPGRPEPAGVRRGPE